MLCLRRNRFGFLLLLGLTGMPSNAQPPGAREKPAQLHTKDLQVKNGQILSYRYLSGSADVVMNGTELAPGARIRLKVGSRPGFVELDINRGQITGLKPASQFGGDFLTYVLWAVSVDGKAANLGEITFHDDKPVSINVTTPYQTFWLMLTAEPNYAVVDPSLLVVLYSVNENSVKPSLEKTAMDISSPLFYYTHYSADYDRKPTKSNSTPNALLQARKAVELATRSGILTTGSATGSAVREEQRTREALQRAREFLKMAEDAYKADPNGNDVSQFSRTAAQIAENARALAQGAVGGALVNQLQHEVEQLRAELAKREPESEPPVVEAPVEPVRLPDSPPPKARPLDAVAELISKPVTWFGIVGWVVALLLLFRRRTI
jgi:hypothetical protein